MLLNKDRAQDLMTRHDLDALIACRPENVTYLSDYRCNSIYMYEVLGFQAYALLPRTDDIAAALFTTPHEVPWVVEFPSWMPEVRTFGPKEFVQRAGAELTDFETEYRRIRLDAKINAPTRGDALVKAIKDKGLEGRRIGIELEALLPETRKIIERDLPDTELVDAWELFRVIRIVKSDEEINRLRASAEANERAMTKMKASIQPGVTSGDVTLAFMEATGAEGANFEFWNTSFGRFSAFSFMSDGTNSPQDQILKEGDMIRFDGGSVLHHYHSDTGGTAVIGDPSPEQQKVYDVTRAAYEAGLELLRPGVRPSKIYTAIRDAGEGAGCPDYRHGRLAYGHGIGIEARDWPLIAPPKSVDNPYFPEGTLDIPLEAGMVMCLETGFGELGTGGSQIEQTFVIRDDGPELLTTQDRRLKVL